MAPVGRRRNNHDPEPHGPGELSDGPREDSSLDALVDHCLAAHAIIEMHGTPTMRRLVELLLFEIGSKSSDGGRHPRDLN